MKKILVTVSGNSSIRHSALLENLHDIGNYSTQDVDLAPNCRPGRYVLTISDERKVEIIKDQLLVVVSKLSEVGVEVDFNHDF